MLNTVNTVFLLTCRVICGKSEPERLNATSVNFVIVKFLFAYVSVKLLSVLFIRLFNSYYHYHDFGEIKICNRRRMHHAYCL